MRKPQDCITMDDVRAGIDELDAALIALLVRRAAFIDRAAEIKESIGWPARIDTRVEQVVENVRRHAGAAGLSPDLAEGLWRQLIDWSIAREEQRLGPDADRRPEP